MAAPRTVDTHTHVLTEETMALLNKELPKAAVKVTPIDKDFEVDLKIEGKAEVGSTMLFAFDLTFGGVFRIQNVPQEQVQPIVLIECPRILFPFAREIVATSVRNGGFPPLMLDPIDFIALYQQRMAQVAPPAATA